MTGAARIMLIGCLVALVAGSVTCPAGAEAANRPSNPQAEAALLGISYTWDKDDIGSYDRAMRAFESLRTDYAGTLEADLAFVELLRMRWLKGDQEGVLRDYQQWLSTGPSPIAQGHALEYFGDSARTACDYAEAEQLYKQAMTLASKHTAAAMAALRLAEMYVEDLNRASDGFALYEQTAKDFVGTAIEPEVRSEWARAVEFHAGPAATASAEARETASKILEPMLGMSSRSPWLAKARYNLAEYLVALNRPSDALRACELAAADIEPERDRTWAHGCLRRLMDVQGQFERWDDAIATARKYIQLFPDRDPSSAQITIGYAYARKGDLATAAREFGKVVTQYRGATYQCALALYQKANCERGLGDVAAAKSTLEQLIRDYPDTYWAIRAKRQPAAEQ